jgi:outer membrane lipoprotein-sorting protein
MRKSFLLSLTAALATGLLSGCGDSSAKVSSADLKAFDSAPAEVKLAWTTALAASETNGYVLAVSTLRGLAGQRPGTGYDTQESRASVLRWHSQATGHIF